MSLGRTPLPTLLCSSAPSRRCCCFYAHPAAVKLNSLQMLRLSWEQAVKHDTNWTFHPLWGQTCCFYSSSGLSWTEVERTDSFLVLQLAQVDVPFTHQISAKSLLTNPTTLELSGTAGEMERRAKHPNKVNSQACIIYYSLIVILSVKKN